MVERTELVERVDHRLYLGHLMLDELDEFTAEWDNLSTDERLSWAQDWGQFAVAGMRDLHAHARHNEMTIEQAAEYQRLLQRIADRTATIEAYQLGMPQVPVQTT